MSITSIISVATVFMALFAPVFAAEGTCTAEKEGECINKPGESGFGMVQQRVNIGKHAAGDSQNPPPPSPPLTLLHPGNCAFTVEFETMSGVQSSGSGTGATMAFRIGGQWTDEMLLFESVGNPGFGVSSGEVKETEFHIQQWPTQVRITAGGIDALGYQRIDFVLANGVHVPIVSADAGNLAYPTSANSPSARYWVDGDQVAPTSNVYDVPPPPPPDGHFTVVFETMSGVQASGSGTGATMAFRIGGQWSQEMLLFDSVGNPGSGASSGQVKETEFHIQQWPTQVRITAGGNDALGYQNIDFVLPNGVHVPIVSATAGNLAYPTSANSPSARYWVDGDQVAPNSNTFDVPQDVNLGGC